MTSAVDEKAIDLISQGALPLALDQLTGFDPVKTAELVAAQKAAPITLDASEVTGYTLLGKRAHVTGLGSRRFVQENLEPIAEHLGISVIVKSSNGLMDFLNDFAPKTKGALKIFIMGGEYHKSYGSTQVAIDGQSYKLASKALAPLNNSFNMNREVVVDGHVVGRYSTDGYMVLALGLCLNGSGNGFSHAERVKKFDLAILERIMQSTLNEMTGVQRVVDLTAEQATVKTALFWQNADFGQNLPDDITAALQLAQNARTESREQIVNLQKEINQLKKDRAQMRQNILSRIEDIVKRGDETLLKIGALAAVDTIERMDVQGKNGFHVVMNDVVLLEEKAKVHRLIPALTFSFAINPGGGYVVEFKEAKYHAYQLHPHVFKYGKNPCFGEAQTLLEKAAQMQDPHLFVSVIGIWAANSLQKENYLTGLQSFPPTDLPLGYNPGGWDARPNKDEYPDVSKHKYINAGGEETDW